MLKRYFAEIASQLARTLAFITNSQRESKDNRRESRLHHRRDDDVDSACVASSAKVELYGDGSRGVRGSAGMDRGVMRRRRERGATERKMCRGETREMR